MFEYTVSNNGVISYDNAQNSSLELLTPVVSSALASEMRNQAKRKVPGSLKGRSVWGISFELQVHLLARMLGIKVGNTDTTEVGATKGDVGYDYNADWFEHPLRNLVEILDAIFN